MSNEPKIVYKCQDCGKVFEVPDSFGCPRCGSMHFGSYLQKQPLRKKGRGTLDFFNPLFVDQQEVDHDNLP